MWFPVCFYSPVIESPYFNSYNWMKVCTLMQDIYHRGVGSHLFTCAGFFFKSIKWHWHLDKCWFLKSFSLYTVDMCLPPIPFLICTTQTPPAASCWVIATALSYRGRRVTLRITQRPFVLGRCPASDTHGGCTRQAALRAGGSPLAAPALLLRRIPRKERTERKGRLARCSAMLFPVHAVLVAVVSECVCARARAQHTGFWAPIPTELSTSFLC